MATAPLLDQMRSLAKCKQATGCRVGALTQLQALHARQRGERLHVLIPQLAQAQAQARQTGQRWQGSQALLQGHQAHTDEARCSTLWVPVLQNLLLRRSKNLYPEKGK